MSCGSRKVPCHLPKSHSLILIRAEARTCAFSSSSCNMPAMLCAHYYNLILAGDRLLTSGPCVLSMYSFTFATHMNI